MIAAIDPVSAIGLGWTVASSVIGGVVSGLVIAFVLGSRFGTFKARVEAVERTASDTATKAAAKEWVNERVAALHEATTKAAQREWVEGQIDSERTGRERIHRELDDVKRRLDQGDKRFDALTRVEGAADALTEELRATQRMIATFATKGDLEKEVDRIRELCTERHKRLEPVNAK